MSFQPTRHESEALCFVEQYVVAKIDAIKTSDMLKHARNDSAHHDARASAPNHALAARALDLHRSHHATLKALHSNAALRHFLGSPNPCEDEGTRRILFAMAARSECASVAIGCAMLRPSLWQRHHRGTTDSTRFLLGHTAKERVAHVRESIRICVPSIRMIHEGLRSMSMLNEQQAKIVHPSLVQGAQRIFPHIKSTDVVSAIDEMIQAVYTTLHLGAVGWLELYVGAHDAAVRALSRPHLSVVLNDDLLGLVLGPTVAHVVANNLSPHTVRRTHVMSEIVSLSSNGQQVVPPASVEGHVSGNMRSHLTEHATSHESNLEWVHVLNVAMAVRRVCRAWANASMWNLSLCALSCDAPTTSSASSPTAPPTASLLQSSPLLDVSNHLEPPSHGSDTQSSDLKRNIMELHLLENDVEQERKTPSPSEAPQRTVMLERLIRQRDMLRNRLLQGRSLRAYVSTFNRKAAIATHMGRAHTLTPATVFGMSSRTGCNTAFDHESNVQRITPYAQCHIGFDGTRVCTSALTICMRVQLVHGFLGTVFAHPVSHAVLHVRCQVEHRDDQDRPAVLDVTDWAYDNERLIGSHKTVPQRVALRHGGASIFFKLKASNRELSEAVGATACRVRFVLARGPHVPQHRPSVAGVTGDWMVVRTETRERLHNFAKKRSLPDQVVALHPPVIRRARTRAACE